VFSANFFPPAPQAEDHRCNKLVFWVLYRAFQRRGWEPWAVSKQGYLVNIKTQNREGGAKAALLDQKIGFVSAAAIEIILSPHQDNR
jgi:hypothetical protein